MPHPFPLATVFSGGMRRDVDRTELPGECAYNMLDFIPDEVQAVTAGRGGWTYAGGAMTGVTGIEELGLWQDPSTLTSLRVVAATSDGKLWNPVTATSLGSLPLGYAASPPFYHRGKLIFPNGLFGAGTASTNYYDGTTIGTISAVTSGQQITVGCTYKDHSVLANTSQGTQRILFSAAGDPTTWDTSYGYWDTSAPIAGVAALLNCLLVFHADSTERLRGTTPPPGSDMTLEPFIPNVGCIDPHSIAYWQNRVIWCGPNGIYMSDGATVVDLTAQAGMKTYWQSLLSGYTAPALNGGYSSSFWRISGGIYRNHYVVSINNGSTLVDCLCIALDGPAFWRFSNLHGAAFLNVQLGQQEKLYMGQWNAGRVAELSSLWNPSATVKKDGDNTVPTPTVETAMFRGYDRLHRRWVESMGKQKWRFGYVDYDLRDAATDNPTGALSYCTTPTGSYTQAGIALPETTDISRVIRPLNATYGGATRSQMIGFKLAVTGPYSSAKLYALECDFSPMSIGSL